MSVCPWCKGSVPTANEPCPLCGQHPLEHPSLQSQNVLGLPELEELDEPAVPLELETVSRPAPSAVPSSSPSAASEVDRRPASVSAPPAPSQVTLSKAPAPTALVPSAASQVPGLAPHFDPVAVALLADFGPRPSRWWQAPLYAARVWMRQRTLTAQLRQARQAVSAAQQRVEAVLQGCAERLRPQLKEHPWASEQLEALEVVEQNAQGRRSALETRKAEHAQRLGEIETQSQSLKTQTEQARQGCDQAQEQLEQKQEALGRATALHKRAEIELRNLDELTRAPRNSQAPAAPTAEALQAARQTLEQRKSALAAPQQEFNQAQALLTEREQALRALEQKLRQLKLDRSRLEQSFERELGLHTQGVQQVQTERRLLLLRLGNQLALQHPDELTQEEKQEYEKAQTLLAARALEAERIVRAIDSADLQLVRRGWGLAVLGLLGLVAIVWGLRVLVAHLTGLQ